MPASSRKVAILTGASSGIGRAILHALVEDGYLVEAFGRKSEEEFLVAAGVENVHVHYRTLDVRDLPALQDAVRSVANERGALHVVVNAAGIMHFENADGTEPSSIDEQLATNLAGPIALCSAAAAVMSEAGGGHIVNIASTVALRAAPKLAVYAATKAGLLHYSRSIAAELAGRGVRVNVVCPGAVQTNLAPRVHFKLIERTIPLGRLQTAEEIAGLVRWLLSDAARNVTGSVLTLDGGMSL